MNEPAAVLSLPCFRRFRRLLWLLVFLVLPDEQIAAQDHQWRVEVSSRGELPGLQIHIEEVSPLGDSIHLFVHEPAALDPRG